MGTGQTAPGEQTGAQWAVPRAGTYVGCLTTVSVVSGFPGTWGSKPLLARVALIATRVCHTEEDTSENEAEAVSKHTRSTSCTWELPWGAGGTPTAFVPSSPSRKTQQQDIAEAGDLPLSRLPATWWALGTKAVERMLTR